MELSVHVAEHPVAEVRITGPITQSFVTASSEPLISALGPEAYSYQVLLDLRNSDQIDSSGVNWLLTLHRRMRESGGRLILHSLPPIVDNVLKVLRMNLVFEIAANQYDARQMLAGDAA